MPPERFRVIWSSRAQGAYNLFARLSPQTEQRLADGEVSEAKGNTFLPLALKFEGCEEYSYVSFNGGIADVSENDLGECLRSDVAFF